MVHTKIQSENDLGGLRYPVLVKELEWPRIHQSHLHGFSRFTAIFCDRKQRHGQPKQLARSIL
jgi:hypothetical protein